MTSFSFSLFCIDLYAAELKIEPIYGVERTQRYFPEPTRYKTQTFFGVRALYGVPTFSAELELNQSQDSEEFPSDNLEVTYKTQSALFGFRTYPIASKYIGAYLRFGARARKYIETRTENGEETTEERPITLDPYGGAGFTLVFGNNFALNAGATLVYNRDADEAEKYDTRYTLSFTFKASNR